MSNRQSNYRRRYLRNLCEYGESFLTDYIHACYRGIAECNLASTTELAIEPTNDDNNPSQMESVYPRYILTRTAGGGYGIKVIGNDQHGHIYLSKNLYTL